jgi:hypothetical protein
MVADDDETFQKRHKLHSGQQVLFNKKREMYKFAQADQETKSREEKNVSTSCVPYEAGLYTGSCLDLKKMIFRIWVPPLKKFQIRLELLKRSSKNEEYPTQPD